MAGSALAAAIGAVVSLLSALALVGAARRGARAVAAGSATAPVDVPRPRSAGGGTNGHAVLPAGGAESSRASGPPISARTAPVGADGRTDPAGPARTDGRVNQVGPAGVDGRVGPVGSPGSGGRAGQVGPAELARRAGRWLAAAALSAGLGLAGVALLYALNQPKPLAGWVAAIATAAACTALGIGVSRLDGPMTGALRLRIGLDCLVVGASAVYVLWIVVAKQTDPANLEAPVALATVSAALVLGAVLASLVARPGYGRGSRLAGLAAVVLAAGLALVTATVVHGPQWSAIAVLAASAGAALLVPTIRIARLEPNLAPRPPLGLKLPLIAVLADCGAALYETINRHVLGLGGVIIACTVALGLALRQALYQKDERAVTLELAEREQRYKEMAHTDSLTSLANRRELTRVLAEAAGDGRPCALIAIDLDGFKDVNEMGGHELGDAVLIEVADRLGRHLREGDVAARVGGDEFDVLLWATPEEANATAQRLLAVLGEPFEAPGHSTVRLTASMGLATAPDGALDSLMRNADLALRFAKHVGEGGLEVYDPEYETFLRRNLAIERELSGAAGRGELSLVYQPVMALPGERLVGVEALIRWDHPELGKVSPGDFIPIAEECGLIRSIGAWVLHEACGQLASWLADGYDVWVSVNVSVRELREPDYVPRLVTILKTHQVPAHRLVLEVTEHALAVDLQQLVGRLYELRDVGVRFALDDFGAGYSSLNQLRSLPVDILKIDRALVIDTVREPLAPKPVGPLVDVVVALAQRLGLQVIAEGVEKPPHRVAVEEAGCGLVQGYLFAGPKTVADVKVLLDGADRTTTNGSVIVS